MVRTVTLDGGGSAPPPQPAARPQKVTVANGQTLLEIADRYRVTPQAIREANPQVFRHIDRDRREEAGLTGDVLFDGDVLTIPAAPMSVTEDPVNSDSVNPAFPSPNSEYGVGPLTFNPEDGTVKVTAEQQLELSQAYADDPFGLGLDKRGLKIGVTNKQEVSAGSVVKDGNTEVGVEFVATTSVKGGAEFSRKGGIGFEADDGSGTRFKYKVVLPGERDPAQAAELAAKIDPTDPTTIPDGVTVTMDGQDFASSGFGASFRYVAARSDHIDARGLTYSITRHGDSVSVLTGPTRVIESFRGAGVANDDFTAIVGRQDLLSDSKLQAATFDLKHPDGQAAYGHFLLTGQVAHETPGVSGVASIGRVDMSSQTRAKLDAGPLAVDLAGAQTTSGFVRTDFPDGSFTQTFSFRQADSMDRVPLQITSRFDASGNEIVSERTYSYTIETDQPGTAERLNTALNGGILGAGWPVQPNGKATLVFTQAQMEQLMVQAGRTRDAYRIPSQGDRVGLLLGGPAYDSAPATPASFAVRMSTSLGSDAFGFCDRLVEIARGADGDLMGGGMQPIEATIG